MTQGAIKTIRIFLLSLALGLVAHGSPLYADLNQPLRSLSCKAALSPSLANGPVVQYKAGENTRDIESIEFLNFGTINTLDMIPHERVKSAKEGDPGFLAKPESQLAGIAEGIRRGNLDIVSLQEVGSEEILNYFSRKYLDNEYYGVLIQGNDQRGINVGFLVKRDLPVDIEAQSNRDLKVKDSESPTFVRDFPALIVREKGATQSDAPLAVFFGTHKKSSRVKRGRKSGKALDPSFRRAQETFDSMQILKKHQDFFGEETPIFVAGDNNSRPEAPELGSMRKAGMSDVFDLTDPPLVGDARVTHTFHHKDGSGMMVTDRNQYDQISATSIVKEKKLVVSAEVLRWLDENGDEKRIPESYAERSKNPSDHMMAIVKLAFQPMRKLARNPE